MRRGRVSMVVASATAVWMAGTVAAACGAEAAVSASGSVVPAAGAWGKAIAVPGLRALNTREHARLFSMSCSSAGNCAAGGQYHGRHGTQAFVVSARRGRWGKATTVPGVEAVNTARYASVLSVSCGSPGNCAAGGFYDQPANLVIPFIATERNGQWGKARSLPADGAVYSISCASAGNCLVGGQAAGQDVYYAPENAFFVEERAGHWEHFRRVPGLRMLKRGNSSINSVSCPSAGNCVAGGTYHDRTARQGFVIAERNGQWGRAIEVPGLAALNAGGNAELNSVSCGSAGNCVAVGFYEDGAKHLQGYTVTERNGRWGRAVEVLGVRTLNASGNVDVNSVSCGSAGNCAAGGSYNDASGHLQGFTVVERNGHWGRALELPGLGALNKGGNADVNEVSCASAGDCAADGYYTGGSGHGEGFVAREVNGVWRKAIPIPGLRALTAGGSAQVDALSCGSPGHCAAGGSFGGFAGDRQAFVTQAG